MITKETIKEVMPEDKRIWTCNHCGVENSYAAMMEHECEPQEVRDSKAQFEKAFVKWSVDHPEIHKALESQMGRDLLHDVAAYFYHTGGTDASLDLRAILADALAKVQR